MTDLPDAANLPEPIEWHPSPAEGVAMNVAGAVLGLAGVIGFGLLWAQAQRVESMTFTFGAAELVGLLVMIGVVALLLVAHEALHGVAMLPYGARPRFGAAMMAKVVPVVYCTAPGHIFTRGQFAVVALAPFLVLNVVLGAAIAWTPFGGWLVLPAAVHLSGCVGDLYLLLRAIRRPAGDGIEDLPTGQRYHPEHFVPATHTS